MKPITGHIITSVDEDEMKSFYNRGWKVICLSESSDSLRTIMPEIMMGTVFLPPYESMDLLLDGNMDAFAMSYSNYLFYESPECELMISIILAALYQGVNIILYIPKSEYELGFYQVFMNCFAAMTGIFPGFSNTICDMYDFKFNNKNLVRLYSDGFILYPDLLLYHDGAITDPQICIRICMDIGFIEDNEVAALSYIRKYKQNIDSNGRFLQKGFIKA